MHRSALLVVTLLLFAVELRAEEAAPAVEVSLDPFDLRGPTFRFWGGELHLGGRLAADLVKYGSDNVKSDGLRWADARLTIEGLFDDFSFLVEPDLVGTHTRRNLWEAWAAYEFCPEFLIRVGQFRIAPTSDFATRGEVLPAVGYGFPGRLAGRHDVGLGIEGELFGGRLFYSAAATAGEGFAVSGEKTGGSLLGLRLLAHPFGGADSCFPDLLRGLYLGGAYFSLSEFDDALLLETPLDNKVFRTRKLGGDSGYWLAFEAGGSWGPVRIGYEHLVGAANGVPVEEGEEDMDGMLAFGWQVAWNVTGEEHRSSRGAWASPDPATKADWAAGFPGRLELALSWSTGDMDRYLILNGYAPEGVDSDETTVWQLMLSWYPNPRTRIGIGWVRSEAQRELGSIGGTNQSNAFGGGDSDSSFVLRIEHGF
jgi:hypothetical protein